MDSFVESILINYSLYKIQILKQALQIKIMDKIELINLTLDEIRRSANMVEKMRMIAGIRCCQKIQNDCNQVLEECRISLRNTLETIANFQNDNDMLTNIDIALCDVSYDLIYERKNEDDFNE